MSFLLCASEAGAQEIIERTLAIVGGQVITLSDARAALALGLVNSPSGVADASAVTPQLIDRMLMLREVQRYAPPEPADAEIDAQVSAIKSRLADPQVFVRALDAGGFSDRWLRAWIRDDLRIAAYLNQRFADERRADLIADWLSDLRRRAVVTELWRVKN
jgi:hypothetical protein